MVNHGRSAGCQTCKARKIKCDETRPYCRKCRNVGKVCPGYPNEWDLAFRSENRTTKLKVQASQALVSNDFECAVVLERLPAKPHHDLTSDVKIQVISLFFQDFVIPTSEAVAHRWLDFLPDVFDKTADDSVLGHAVYAAAYANIAQRHEKSALQYQAISYYYRALKRVNSSVANGSGSTTGDTLIAVMLLGIYECLIGSTSNLVKDSSLCHIHGLGALANLSGILLTTEPYTNLLEIVCCQMQRRNLDLGLMPGPGDERLMQMLDSASIAAQLIHGIHSVSKFLASTNTFLAHNSTDHSSLAGRHHIAMTIDDKLRQWRDDASSSIGYGVSPSPPKHQNLFPSQQIAFHKYADTWTVGVWNKHRASRIILHQTVLHILKKCPSDGQFGFAEKEARSLSVIHDMVQDIFSSVAFSLGAANPQQHHPRGVGGYFLVWSLKVILRCPFVSQEQYVTARNVLWRIGKECALGHALTFAENLALDK